jgi:TRAP-type C4-dicarboxylate transport system substrate-binding protein
LKPHGFRSLGCFNFGGRHLISTFPITQVSDVKGKKMRVLLNPLHVRMWQLAGANPTPIPAAEVYTALQTKVVDYIDNPKSTYLSFKWYEVAKHFTPLGHVNSIIFLTFSDAWFEKLPAEHKAALEKAAAEVLPTINAELMSADDASLAKTVQGGATVHEVKDRAPWRTAMSPVWDDFTKRVPTGAELLKQLGALQ